MVKKIFRYATLGIQAVFKSIKVYGKPVHAQIELTTLCNYNCKSCPRLAVLNNKFKNMPFDQFKKIVEQINPLKITLSGLGEPLLHPDIFKILSYLNHKKIFVRLTTNGSLITELTAKKLIALKLGLLNVSIDAATQSTYGKVRNNKSLDTVKQNILKLNELKKESNSSFPQLRTSFVIQRDNFREMKEFIDFTQELGITDISFQPLAFHFIKNREGKLVGNMQKDLLLKELNRAYYHSLSCKVNTNLKSIIADFHDYWENYSGGEVTGTFCIKPWISVYITVDGDIKPCCCLVSKEGTFGNFKTNNFSNIWNSIKYQNLRKTIKKSGGPFTSCKHCISNKIPDFVKSTCLFFVGVL